MLAQPNHVLSWADGINGVVSLRSASIQPSGKIRALGIRHTGPNASRHHLSSRRFMAKAQPRSRAPRSGLLDIIADQNRVRAGLARRQRAYLGLFRLWPLPSVNLKRAIPPGPFSPKQGVPLIDALAKTTHHPRIDEIPGESLWPDLEPAEQFRLLFVGRPL